MARQRHGDAFRYARSHKISDSGSSEIVWDPSRTPRRHPRLAPLLVVARLGDPLAGFLAEDVAEHTPRDDAALACEIVREVELIVEDPSQFPRERKRAGLPVLRRARVEPDLASLHVDVSPFEREDLARRAPARDERKGGDPAHIARQMVLHALILLAFEKPLPDVGLF